MDMDMDTTKQKTKRKQKRKKGGRGLYNPKAHTHKNTHNTLGRVRFPTTNAGRIRGSAHLLSG